MKLSPKNQHILVSVLAAVGLSTGSSLAQAEPLVEPFEFTTSYETWQLPAKETMGMASVGMRKQVGEGFSLGAESFGGVKGKRGGFITLGMTAGYELPLTDNLALEAAVHVGAGGGASGAELVGGGLFLRQNLGLSYRTKAWGSLGFGVSHVDFPKNGTIGGNQAYVTYRLPFTMLTEVGGSPDMKEATLESKDFPGYKSDVNHFSLLVRDYKVKPGSLTTGGLPQADLKTLGAEWRSFHNDNWYTRIEAGGAMKGSSQGYMHILLGGGYQYPVTDYLVLHAGADMGVAGGGAVNTAGGLLYGGHVGIQVFPLKSWFVDVTAGRLKSKGGSLDSNSLALHVGYQFGANSDEKNPLLFAHPLRVRLADQHYRQAAANWRSKPDQSVGNLGFQLDYLLNNHVYLTGQALAAYTGDAGAYMTGQVGAGVHYGFWHRFFVEAEGLVGAAGGGGLHTGSGLVYQGNLSLGYQVNKAIALMATAGRISATSGDFKANVIGVSITYRFDAYSAQN